MNIVLFAHPDFLGQQSMPRFVQMLYKGLTNRGHSVSILQPRPVFYKLPFLQSKRKWLGYIDQYIVFPQQSKKIIKSLPSDTLFVYTDQALGPWIPMTRTRRHVVHCHDFLAQRSALGEFKENVTGASGRLYQKFIRKGYRQARHFISVSNKTQTDLHRFLQNPPATSTVVYNGLNQVCQPTDYKVARTILSKAFEIRLEDGYFLHVGGNDWYKNRLGVIEMYDAWCKRFGSNLPLLLIGTAPSDTIKGRAEQSEFSKQIHFLSGITDENVRLAYSGATALLFSIAG